jgi:hypothetical protein
MYGTSAYVAKNSLGHRTIGMHPHTWASQNLCVSIPLPIGHMAYLYVAIVRMYSSNDTFGPDRVTKHVRSSGFVCRVEVGVDVARLWYRAQLVTVLGAKLELGRRVLEADRQVEQLRVSRDDVLGIPCDDVRSIQQVDDAFVGHERAR